MRQSSTLTGPFSQARNVTMRNIVAYGTHGIAVSCKTSSNGTAPVGGDYLFENAVVYDSLIGARFKGSVGQSCHVSNVVWRNITTYNTSYPVHFIENYVDQAKGVADGLDLSLAGFASNFTWDNIVARTGEELRDGTCVSDPCWQATLGEQRMPIALGCRLGDELTCRGLQGNRLRNPCISCALTQITARTSVSTAFPFLER